MFKNLTYQELDSILGRARIGFKRDYETYHEERDLMLANLCKELQDNITYDTNAMFFKIEDYENGKMVSQS